jgi:hypothetical protein
MQLQKLGIGVLDIGDGKWVLRIPSVCLVIARRESTKQSLSNVDYYASGNPPSPQPSPVKGEGEQGSGYL